MKKIYYLFLLALLPLVASANALEINGIYYDLRSNIKLAVVIKNPNGYTGKVVIPKTVTYEGVKYGVISIGNYAFEGCSGLTSVTIPNSVISIGCVAFSGCSGLTSVTIPNSVTSIGNFAFYGCSGLTSVTISNSVTEISHNTFGDCSGLTSVAIPNSVTKIGSCAFYGCSGLTSVTISNSVTDIGEHAFNGCSGLTSVTIPNSVTSIANSSFEDCSGLTSVTIPNSVTDIGEFAFYGCSSLTSVTIPNSVTSIGEDAFFRCSNLAAVTIGNGIKSIGDYAFADCPELKDVYCYAENVHKTDEDAFEDSYIEHATLHVPAGSVDVYKAKTPWSGFKDVVAIAATVKLNKTKATIEKTKTLTLKATVTPSDLLDKNVTWKSSNTAVATVTSKGKVTGVKAGTATITCISTVSGAKATCKVTVGYVKLDQTEAVVKKGKTITLTPTVYPSSLTDKSVTWTSSDTNVATVTSAGKVKGVKTGTATITCTSVATGLSTTCEVLVGNVVLNKYTANLKKGKTVTLKATVYPTSLEDRSVTWKSSDSKIASVTSAGKVKGIGYGTATITCTSVVTGLSRTCQVTVGDVVLDKSEATVKKGKTVTLTATVYPSTLEDKSVTWESSDKSIATVTSAGKVKGIKAGTATITCTSVATGLSGTCTVTVTATSGSRSVDGDDDDTTSIENLEETPALAEPYDVYDLSGRKVLNQVNSLDGLPDGVYIVNGKRILKKK